MNENNWKNIMPVYKDVSVELRPYMKNIILQKKNYNTDEQILVMKDANGNFKFKVSYHPTILMNTDILIEKTVKDKKTALKLATEYIKKNK